MKQDNRKWETRDVGF